MADGLAWANLSAFEGLSGLLATIIYNRIFTASLDPTTVIGFSHAYYWCL